MNAPRKMSPAHRAQAKSLAVSYNAFQEAVSKRSDNGIACWGKLLLQDYRSCGFTLGDPANTQALVDGAMARLAAAERVAA